MDIATNKIIRMANPVNWLRRFVAHLSSKATNNPTGILELLEVVSFFATFIIFVGVAIELPIDWGNLPRKIADLLIDIGLLFEAGAIILAILVTRLEKAKSDREVANANKAAEEARERAAKADLARANLEKLMAPRSLTKEQFDILQKLRGKISTVIVASDADSEPSWFAHLIAMALQNADIQVGLITRGSNAHSTANFICDKRAFSNPDGEPTNGEPFVSVFNEAGIPLSGILAARPMDLPETDPEVPVIVIGGRFIVPPTEPYLGPSNRAPPATMLERIRNP